MNLRPVTKLDKRKKATSKKKINDDDMSPDCDVIVLMANLDHSRSRILDAWSLKLTFSLIVTLEKNKT